MAIIGKGISHRGFVHEDFNIPFNLKAGIVAADVGKPVALDSTAARTVKLAGDNDVIIGVLASWEDRVVEGVLVGTVAMKGGFALTGVSGHSIAVGDTVIGSATDGEVKAAVSADYTQNIVTAVTGDVIEVLIG